MRKTIYITQAAHTDLGYTHTFEQVQRMYLDHYDQVLEFCRQTADRASGEQFKWVCESAWQVRHYVTCRPERTAEFVDCVRRGQIEITANYLHYMDMVDADALRRGYDWIVQFSQKHQLPLKSAIHADINGWPWATADVLAELGVRNFATCVHVDNGISPFDRPDALNYLFLTQPEIHPDTPTRRQMGLWWSGPRGGRVFTWVGEHYQLGNFLGLASGQSLHVARTRFYTHLDHVAVDDLLARAETDVPRYLERLSQLGYDLSATWIPTGGHLYDNAAPSLRSVDLIRRWNDKHGDRIELKSALLSDWFDYLQTQRADKDWPVYQAAWPCAWASGVATMAREVAIERETQRLRPAVIDLRGMVTEARPAKEMDQLIADGLEQERMALEHTYGTWDSYLYPYSPGSVRGTIGKKEMFYDANILLSEAAEIGLHSLCPPHIGQSETLATLHAFVPQSAGLLDFLSGPVSLNPDRQQFTDANGQTVRFQAVGDGRRYTMRYAGLTSGYQRFRLLPCEPDSTACTRDQHILENRFFRLNLATDGRGVIGLLDKAMDRDWVGVHPDYIFGQAVHETYALNVIGVSMLNLHRAVKYHQYKREHLETLPRGPFFRRSAFDYSHGVECRRGPVFDELVISSDQMRHGKVTTHWRLYHELAAVELLVAWDKPWSMDLESFFVTFPLAIAKGHVFVDNSGGLFQAGLNGPGGQIPGTTELFYTVQRGLWAEDQFSGIAILPVDAPLMMLNEMDFCRWDESNKIFNGLVASMPVNSYWHTNFARVQEGPFHWRYLLGGSGRPGSASAEQALRQLTPAQALGWTA